MSTILANSANYAPLENSAAIHLNPRQISFIDNYIDLKVGWKAAEAAGYSGNRDTLSAIASENLRKPSIAAYYAERLRERHISSDEVLSELGELAKFNVADMGKDCVVRPVDKLKALELAGKYHKLWDRNESDSQLSDSDIARLGESIVGVMMEAARRKRMEAMQSESLSNPVIDVTPNSE